MEELETIRALQESGIIPNQVYCDTCQIEMSLHKNRDNYVYRCSSCRKVRSVRKGMSCERSRLSLGTIVSIILSWFDEHTLAQAAERARVTITTASAWYRVWRTMCVGYLESFQQPIGRPGIVVEVDETLISRRKYNCGRLRQEIWAVGGIERAVGAREANQPLRLFIELVENRTAETLGDLLRRRVLCGTEIHTDKWGGYVNLNRLGYRHLTVNHSTNFIDPDTRAHTQTIECIWKHLKAFLPDGGVRATYLNFYLADFVYRKTLRPTRERAVLDVLNFDPSAVEEES